MSFVSIDLLVVTAPQYKTFPAPAVPLSIIAMCDTVPQFAVAALKVTVAEFEAVPLEAAPNEIDCLEYAVPEVEISEADAIEFDSKPVLAVKSARYSVDG